jgi:polar amino acid transport system ATP-binding protein
MSPGELAVRMKEVTKRYADVNVLNDFSVDVPAMQKVAIIGRSGSGKTTLLRLLMGLERPDAGSIEVFGALADGPGPLERGARSSIGMVFQQFNLFPHMSVLANVMEAPVRVLKLSKSEAVDRAMELLTWVGIPEKAHHHPRQLSGGQQQRVAIARALAMHPKILLFDEVTSALDPELIDEVLKVIRRIAEERSVTMLLVTHEMTFARDIADRVIFMDSGAIVEDAPPGDIFTNPKNERTRAFLRKILA